VPQQPQQQQQLQRQQSQQQQQQQCNNLHFNPQGPFKQYLTLINTMSHTQTFLFLETLFL